MGSAVGTSPGRLVETDADFNIIHEWPEDVEGTLNILEQQFSPHGLSIDWEKKLILTSDFVEPITILKPSLGVRHADTLRLWDLDSRKILSTLTIPNVIPPLIFNFHAYSNSIRVVVSKMSSSFPDTRNLLLLPLPCTWVSFGSSTLSEKTPMAIRVWLRNSTILVPRPVTPSLSSEYFKCTHNVHHC